ncbi:carbonic anhydrase [Dongia mobilis]|jgi:carbonic anhydrase|uniref:carbonic anhydrase n=1 Tax=Dongia sp. TaxID=1977262 RepID=UPI0026F09BAA
MDRLISGYRRFRTETWPAERDRYQALAKRGQRPETLVIACSDSRVDPQTVFGTGPGELFVVRNVAGLVPPYQPDAGYHGTSAALEFGVRVLKVARIVVLGHARCGGVQAIVEGAPAEAQDFVVPWMSIAKSALDAAAHRHGHEEERHSRLDLCEAEVVRVSLANLLTFPWIKSAVAGSQLALHGFRFDIHTGTLARITVDGFEAVV